VLIEKIHDGMADMVGMVGMMGMVDMVMINGFDMMQKLNPFVIGRTY
jgi:hypothetical protein